MVGGFLRLGFVFLSTKAVFVLQKGNVSKGYNNWGRAAERIFGMQVSFRNYCNITMF